MKYFFIKKNTDLAGVPIFLDAVLSEELNESGSMPSMRYDWRRKTTHGRKAPFPKEVYLIAKNVLLKADYLNDFGGFIVSKEFLNLIQISNSKPFDKVKLKTIGWKGKNITSKDYYFIDYLFNNRLQVIDYGKSLFAWDISELKYEKKNVTNLDKKEYSRFIKGYKELYIDNVELDIFQLRDSNLANYLICNEKFKEKIIENNLYGFDFVELPDLGNLFESTYNYGQVKWSR